MSIDALHPAMTGLAAYDAARRMAKPQYAAVRRPFAFFYDRLLARYCNQDVR